MTGNGGGGVYSPAGAPAWACVSTYILSCWTGRILKPSTTNGVPGITLKEGIAIGMAQWHTQGTTPPAWQPMQSCRMASLSCESRENGFLVTLKLRLRCRHMPNSSAASTDCMVCCGHTCVLSNTATAGLTTAFTSQIRQTQPRVPMRVRSRLNKPEQAAFEDECVTLRCRKSRSNSTTQRSACHIQATCIPCLHQHIRVIN